jgi:hypothetical protein
MDGTDCFGKAGKAFRSGGIEHLVLELRQLYPEMFSSQLPFWTGSPGQQPDVILSEVRRACAANEVEGSAVGNARALRPIPEDQKCF